MNLLFLDAWDEYFVSVVSIEAVEAAAACFTGVHISYVGTLQASKAIKGGSKNAHNEFTPRAWTTGGTRQ